jgi:hypothetical protein
MAGVVVGVGNAVVLPPAAPVYVGTDTGALAADEYPAA